MSDLERLLGQSVTFRDRPEVVKWKPETSAPSDRYMELMVDHSTPERREEFHDLMDLNENNGCAFTV